MGVILRDTIAVVVPATIVAAHPEFTNTEWDAQTIYDSISFDAGSSFGDHIEALRLNAKRVEVYASLQGWSADISAGVSDLDTYVSAMGSKIVALANNSSKSYDPSQRAVIEEFDRRQREGQMGTFVPTGIHELDGKLGGGLLYDPGELVIISGREKQRKTTLAINMLMNMLWSKHINGFVWVSNEGSYDRVQAFADMWAMAATRISLERGLSFSLKDGTNIPRVFTRDNLMYGLDKIHGSFLTAVMDARAEISQYHISYYFAGHDEGNSHDFEGTMARVRAELEFNDMKVVVLDNMQGWAESGEKDYDTIMRVLPPIDILTAQHHALTIALSQLSAEGRLRGGTNTAARANLVMSTAYNGQETPDMITVKNEYARKRGFFELNVAIDRSSGLIRNDIKVETLTIDK